MSRARRRCSRALTPKCTSLKIARSGTGDGAGGNGFAQLLQIDWDSDGRVDFEIQLNATGGAVTLADLIL